MKTQKQAVCDALLLTLNERGVEYELNGDVNIKDVLTPEDKVRVREQITQGFYNSEIQMSPQAIAKFLSDDKKLRNYVGGLVNNWIKKAREFNGGEQYKPKNPGSRAGNGDEQVKALRALLKTTDDVSQVQLINEALAKRLAEIRPATVTINVNDLPEHLRHLV